MADSIALADYVTMTRERSRRWKVFHLDPQVILCLLSRWKSHDLVQLPVLTDVPEDSIVEDVVYEPMQMAFLVRVSHPSFPEVPMGERIPSASLTHEVVAINGRLIQRLAEQASRMGIDDPPPKTLLLECHEIAQKAKMGEGSPLTTREQLERVLHHSTWQTLRVIADTYEEEGDLVASAGYRWLAEHRKHPRRDTDWTYHWAEQHWPDNDGLDGTDYVLPQKACELLPGWGDSEGPRQWCRSLPLAYAAAASAVGRWLLVSS